MRRNFLLIGGALLVGGAIGSIAIFDAGYVRVEFFGWVTESNLIVAVGGLLIAYFVLRALLRLVSALVHSGASFSRLRERYKHGKSLARARVGVLQFAAGNWQQAADELAEAAAHSSEPVTVWLNAAAAARRAGNLEAMQRAIAEARSLTGEVPQLILMEARWQIEDGKAPEAVRMLRDMNAATDTQLVKDIAARRQLLLAEAYSELGDQESLAGALSALKKAKGVKAEEYRGLEIAHARTSFDALEMRARSMGTALVKKDVDAAWKKVPKHLRNEPLLVRRKMEALEMKAEES